MPTFNRLGPPTGTSQRQTDRESTNSFGNWESQMIIQKMSVDEIWKITISEGHPSILSWFLGTTWSHCENIRFFLWMLGLQMVPASCPIGSFLAHSRLLLAVFLKPIAQQRMHSPALSEASCRSPLAFGRAAGACFLFLVDAIFHVKHEPSQGSVVIFLLIHANSTCLNLTLLVGNCQFLWENKQNQTSSSFLDIDFPNHCWFTRD